MHESTELGTEELKRASMRALNWELWRALKRVFKRTLKWALKRALKRVREHQRAQEGNFTRHLKSIHSEEEESEQCQCPVGACFFISKTLSDG